MPNFRDLEKTTSSESDSLPPPVQMSPPPRSQTSPNAADAHLFASPRNNLVVSRTFGAINLDGRRVTVDPNLRMPDCVSRKPRYSWDPLEANLELAVTFGAIAADIEVLPFAPNTAHEERRRSIYDSEPERRADQVHLKFNTTTGNLTLRLSPAPSAHIYMETSTAFGQTRIYLPRNFRGPLTVWSWTRAPRLSAALQNKCTPVSEEGSTTRWFVGDLASSESIDQAKAETLFGAVWIGYVGEEDEGTRALGGTLVHWSKIMVAVVLLCYAICWLPGLLWKLFCWLFPFAF
ncbi:hypothetical protein FB451DRAFT_1265312 [Mycena latifolia]|nr:hypothetical protein FB451DRAFT_1265312 [Mycena latifolia]